MVPHYFFIGVLVFLAAKEFREWIELILSYNEDITDIYTLVIYFPENYKNFLNYADNLENIEIQIISKQVTE